MIDNSPNNSITINGYKCVKDKNGEYCIGGDKYYDSLVTISPNQEYEKGNELRSTITMGRFSEMPLGQINVSNLKDRSGVQTIALTSLGKQYAGNTILDNAINFHYNDPQTDKERQLSVQQVLTMLDSLEIELTPTENMEMLKGKKQYLQAELAKVNEQLKQQENQQR